MDKRYLVGGIALAWAGAAALAAWSISGPETPERCIERFRELADSHLQRAASHEARARPIFTYDITRMENVLEQLVGTSEQRVGMRMTIAHGPSAAALDAFYNADVPPKGAILAADGFSLYRARGTLGSRDETIVEGCHAAPPEARLVHVQWSTAGQVGTRAAP